MPAQGQVVANIGEYVALVEASQQILKSRLDIIAPESGGAEVRNGNLYMNSNSITDVKEISVATLNWTKGSPQIYGLKYAGGAAGTAFANSTTETSLLPVTATGTLVFPRNKWAAYSAIKFKAAMTAGVTGTPTLTLRLKLNGTAIITHVLSLTTTASAFMEAEIVITSATNAMLESRAAANGILGSVVSNAATTVDTTIENTLTFTGQWSAASESNTVTLGLVKCEYMQS